MKILWDKFDKSKIGALQRVTFEGRIFVVQTESEAVKAVGYLMMQKALGFDTETRPTFRPGPMHRVALLQVATLDTCFLFRLCRLGLTRSLMRLLSDTTIRKVALSWKDDTGQLNRLGDFRMGEFIELQQYVRYFGIEDASLQKLFANVFGQKISKSQQLSNWESETLTEAQKKYAATDAWACIRLYEELERLKQNNNWELRKHEETVSE